jgi:hypothetical protein
MKLAGKIVGAIVVVLVVLLIIFRLTGFPPHGGTPGLWLSGPVETQPVADWSFTDQYPVIQVETNGSLGLPHSVNIFCMSYNGQLYLGSTHPASEPYPGHRIWDRNVAHDPHVRLRIDGKIYERVLVHVTDPVEKAAVEAAELKKYPTFHYPKGAEVNIFHVTNG